MKKLIITIVSISVLFGSILGCSSGPKPLPYKPESISAVILDHQPHDMGTGFIINNEGYFITANHVIQGNDHIKIRLNWKMYNATLISQDIPGDVALLKIDKLDQEVNPVVFSVERDVGSEICAIGFPIPDNCNFFPKLTTGKVSGANGSVVRMGNDLSVDTNQFQSSIGTEPGNSGCPVYNDAGHVIGLDDAAPLIDGQENFGHAFMVKSDRIIKLIEMNKVAYTIDNHLHEALIRILTSPSNIFKSLYKNSETQVIPIIDNPTASQEELIMRQLLPGSNKHYLSAKTLSITEYGAPWCHNCTALHEEIVSKGLDRLYSITNINIDNMSSVELDRLGINGIPVLIVHKGGRVIDKIVGYSGDVASRLASDAGE